MAHDVFISYSHKDKAVADAMCATLEQNGIRCWYAPRDVEPGKEWAAAIVEAIQNSRIMVLLFSNFSNVSGQVLREVGQAVNSELPIIPFKLTDTEPSGSMAYYLSSIHWLDALTLPMEECLRQLVQMAAAVLNVYAPGHIDQGLVYRMQRGVKANRLPLGFRQGKWYGYLLAIMYFGFMAFFLIITIIIWFTIDGVETTLHSAVTVSLIWVMFLLPYLICSDLLKIPARFPLLRMRPNLQKFIFIVILEAVLVGPLLLLLHQIDINDSMIKIAENRTYTISVGPCHTVAVQSDGKVVATGDNDFGQCNVSDWSDIIAISTFDAHTVGLKSDGTVVATGYNEHGQCEVSDWEDIIGIGTGYNHTIGLKSDGKVVAAGWNIDGQCSVASWFDIVGIAAGNAHTIGLKESGLVAAVGRNVEGQCDVQQWRDIIEVSGGVAFTVGLKADGTVNVTGLDNYGQNDVYDWKDIVSVAAGYYHTVGLKADGTVVATGLNNFGQCDVSGWKDIVAVAAGEHHTVGLKADGTVVATGNNEWKQCDVSGWHGIVTGASGTPAANTKQGEPMVTASIKPPEAA